MPISVESQASIPPPAYHCAQARGKDALHIDALTLVRSLHPAFLVPPGSTSGPLAVSAPFARLGPGDAPRRYIDSAPTLAWRQADPDAAVGHDPAHHPRPLLWSYRVHTLLCRGAGLPVFFLLSPANVHDAPFARPLLQWALHLYHLRPRVIRLDAGYWDLQLIRRIPTVLEAVAVVPWNPKRQKNRSCLPPTWTAQKLLQAHRHRSFFGRVFLFFHLQRPPLSGWSAVSTRVALTYTASVIVGLAAQQAGLPDLVRSPKRVLAHI